MQSIINCLPRAAKIIAVRRQSPDPLRTAMATVADKYLKSGKWTDRMKSVFALADVDKKGFITADYYKVWIEKINEIIKPDPSLIAALEKVSQEYVTEIGLTPGVQFTEDQYLEAIAKFAAKDRDKGEDSMLYKGTNAFYDVVDKNHDGTITQDEYKLLCKVWGCPEEVAPAIFDSIDKNHNGKLERKELLAYEMDYTYKMD